VLLPAFAVRRVNTGSGMFEPDVARRASHILPAATAAMAINRSQPHRDLRTTTARWGGAGISTLSGGSWLAICSTGAMATGAMKR
jgi:hypothetical protein